MALCATTPPAPVNQGQGLLLEEEEEEGGGGRRRRRRREDFQIYSKLTQ